MSEIKPNTNMPSTPDSFDTKLDNELEKLKSCQQNHALKSCFDCEKMLDCDTRKSYVSAVYKSMSKGEVSGFDF
ncbi:hypothetical protein [Helicobacter sp. T3_23-1056]